MRWVQFSFFSLLCAHNFPSFLHEIDPNEAYGWLSSVHQIKMMIMWREREHEEHDMISLNDSGAVRALRDCGLLKYFRLSGMR